MKYVKAQTIRKALLRLGFAPKGKGCGSGHDVWLHSTGCAVHPVLRHTDISWASCWSLGQEMETKGVCDRRGFLMLLKAAA